MEKIFKIAGLNIGIAILDTVVFSQGFIGLQLSGKGAFDTALGATIIVMSGLVFIIGNYKLLVKKETLINANEIKTPEDYISALKQNQYKKTFDKDIDTIMEQLERFTRKKATIKDILLQKFDSNEMSFGKFEGTIAEVEEVFYINIRSIINKLNAFDDEEYRRIGRAEEQKKFSKEFIQTKIDIYKEYISFVKDSIEDNEQILLKLDRLLLEISKLNSLEDGEIESMNAMKEIDELINRTKLYK